MEANRENRKKVPASNYLGLNTQICVILEVFFILDMKLIRHFFKEICIT